MNVEKYLVLNKYLLSLFGKSEAKELFNELKNKSEGTDSDGKTYFVDSLIGLSDLKIPENLLLKYDENIQTYVRKINFKREPVQLKYFQYLAVLFTEIVLDNLKNRKIEFLNELNEFLKAYNEEEEIQVIDSFSENDLKKLAFWMATGSGKTLIMHINYYQFLNYKLFSPDNILLITPNEGLSKQHLEELQKSGIPCSPYTGVLNSGFKSENEILVIEITKFVEEKKGGGVTLPVESFEGKNLIFVDEGHKGRRSEEQKWAKFRNKLSENGFVFEYSATFGQILSESETEILKEYAKSIIFDYSYKYFYLDGYGKDFQVLNVSSPSSTSDEWLKEFQETMFVAGLLSFYEQLLVYEQNKTIAKEYNIEKPLWIFVGTTVTGKETESDVILIIEFIKRVIQDENWVKDLIEKILSGNTNLKDENGEDIFKEKFKYLGKRAIDFDDLYRRIFGGKGSLTLYELKNAEGEIGLKIGENDYFGVVNIGSVSELKKQLEKKGISIVQDAISSSLFDNIKKENSKVNILIGSKKFIEGWDTWRVSSMGLLNIGRGQGPQIIQLFGRGVRLKGKGMSLKRSGDSPEIQILETLNIYGIKADYLSKFLEAIRREEVELETINIPVEFKHQDKWKDLYTLSKPKEKFEEEILRLKISDRIYYTVNLLPKVSAYLSSEGSERTIKEDEIKLHTTELRFPDDKVDLLDWERIWNELIEFKTQRNYWNLVFEKDDIKNVLLNSNYTLFSIPEIFKNKDENYTKRLEDIALLIIKKYIDLFYRKNAKQFETRYIHPAKVEQLPLPFISEDRQGYKVQINKQEKELLEEIKKLIADFNELLKDDQTILPRVYIDNSLYVPLLLKSEKIHKISPAGLEESEREFVLGLREYLENNRDKIQYEIYLLRNLPFSGIGFQLEWSGFYPDFILWIKKNIQQIIVFIEPHGLGQMKDIENNEKVIFAGFRSSGSDAITIKDIEEKLRTEHKINHISLEFFILSTTRYDDLIEGSTKVIPKEEYEEKHILFLDDENWPEKLFNMLSL